MVNRITALLVEDSSEDLKRIQEMATELESDLFHPVILNLTHASSMKEAMGHADTHFDVILLDLTLPDSTGMHTVNRIIGRFAKTPVVVLTGISDVETGIAAVKSGAQDYLLKDAITSALLLRSIQYAIERLQIVIEKEQLIADLQQSVARIKTLSGLLPICASCKNIRNDKGYWERIEMYITQHSDARLTHGICPDCKKKLYPEFCD